MNVDEDPILNPKLQTAQALMRAATVRDGQEAATWAVAAAVFSLRDTVQASLATAAHIDKSQLTPEEVAEIQRGPKDLPSFSLWGPSDGGSAQRGQRVMPLVVPPPPRPAVTRNQVWNALLRGRGLCSAYENGCRMDGSCTCDDQVDAVMKLLEGGE
jgi:hypothetical protein